MIFLRLMNLRDYKIERWIFQTSLLSDMEYPTKPQLEGFKKLVTDRGPFIRYTLTLYVFILSFVYYLIRFIF